MNNINIAESPPDDWGGIWTKKKTEIVVDYAKAYLTVMKDRKYWKLLYFDGFAGEVSTESNKNIDYEVYFSAAIRVLNINSPRSFDLYYFVELNPKNAINLEKQIKQNFPHKKAYVAKEDCNKKLRDLSTYLKSKNGKNVKVLAFIDPFGMEVKWESIIELYNLPIDLWILVPTGIGGNRLLKKNGNISEAWMKKLKTFLGMEELEIRKYFYKTTNDATLFGMETNTQKEKNVIEKAGELYKSRLNEIFKHVSNPFLLKNKPGSVMFHLYMASNNTSALKIANDIIKPKIK
jgi:three-Cys-motif partner protein